MTKVEWAANLSRDQHWIDLLAEMKQAQVSVFSASRPDEFEVREQAYQRIRFIEELEAHIESLAITETLKEKRWKVL